MCVSVNAAEFNFATVSENLIDIAKTFTTTKRIFTNSGKIGFRAHTDGESDRTEVARLQSI